MQEPSAAAMGSTLSGLASGQAERLLPAPSREVIVEVRSLADNPGVREISARVDVQAPAEMVWRTLTDYERLAGALQASPFACCGSLGSRLHRLLRRHCAFAERKPHLGAVVWRCSPASGKPTSWRNAHPAASSS
jgi:hypothetical protein